MKGFWHKLKRNWKIELMELFLIALTSVFITLSINQYFLSMKKINMDNKDYYKYSIACINFENNEMESQQKLDYYKSALANYEYGLVSDYYIDQKVANNIQFVLTQGEGFSKNYNDDYSEAIISQTWAEKKGIKVGDVLTQVDGKYFQDTHKAIKVVGITNKNLLYMHSRILDTIQNGVSSDTQDYIIKEKDFVPNCAYIFNDIVDSVEILDDNNQLIIQKYSFESIYSHSYNIAIDLFNLSLVLGSIALIVIISITYINMKNIKYVNSLYVFMGESNRSLIAGIFVKMLLVLVVISIIPIIFLVLKQTDAKSSFITICILSVLYFISQIYKIVLTVQTKPINEINKEGK